jgi:predicted double-glycine peptidase
VLGLFAVASFAVAMISRDPLQPLRTVARWSLARRGARFVAGSEARRQSSLNDCGPTALAELIDLSGLAVPSADSLRRLASIKPDGVTLGDLRAAAEVVGLALFRVRWDPAELPLLPLPSLVWVDRNHFVVVSRRTSADSVEVRDPAAGLYRMASERFAHRWSGEALILVDSISPHRHSDARSDSRSHRRGARGQTSQQERRCEMTRAFLGRRKRVVWGGALLALAAATAPAIHAAPARETSTAPRESGQGWGSILGCAACGVAAGGLILGGPGAILVAANTPGSAMAAMACAGVCYEAFQ